MAIFFSTLKMSASAEFSEVNRKGADGITSTGELSSTLHFDEIEVQEVITKEAHMTFFNRVCRDWRIIKQAFSHPTFYRFQIFIALRGLLTPSYFVYQYQ